MIHLNRLTAILDLDDGPFNKKLGDATKRAASLNLQNESALNNQEKIKNRILRLEIETERITQRRIKAEQSAADIQKKIDKKNKSITKNEAIVTRKGLTGDDSSANIALIEKKKKELLRLEERLAEARRKVSAATLNLKTNELDLENAHKSVAQAELKLLKTQQDLNRAMDAGAGIAGKYEEKLTKKVQHGLSSVAQKMHTLGIDLTATLTYPLIQLGKNAINAAVSYEASFAKMKGLTNIPREELSLLNDQVLDLSISMGRTPEELSKALYFIASSGISNATDAFDILTLSTKGSVAGLGKVDEIARVVTATINAYGKENLSAAQIVDALSAAVREGSGEPDKYAKNLGRLISTASVFKIKFESIMAAVAVATNKGLNVDHAITGLRTFITDINRAATGGKNSKFFAELGFDVQKVAKGLQTDLLGTLNAVYSKLKAVGKENYFVHLLPNQRGAVVALSLLAGEAEKTQEIFGALTKAVKVGGDTNLAYAEGSKTMANQIDRAKAAWEAMYISFTPVIEELLPIAVDLIKDVASWLKNTDKETKVWIARIGILAALLGPLTFAIANMLKSFLLAKEMTALVKGLTASTAVLNATTAATTGAAASATASIWLLRAAYLGLYALAAVPIVFTIRAVYDFKSAANDALASANQYGAQVFGPGEYVKGKRIRGDKRPLQEILNEFKKTEAYKRYEQSPQRRINNKAYDDRQRAASGVDQNYINQMINQALKTVPKVDVSGGGGGGGGGSSKNKKAKIERSVSPADGNGGFLFGWLDTLPKINKYLVEQTKIFGELKNTYIGIIDPAERYIDLFGEKYKDLPDSQKLELQNLVSLNDYMEMNNELVNAGIELGLEKTRVDNAWAETVAELVYQNSLLYKSAEKTYDYFASEDVLDAMMQNSLIYFDQVIEQGKQLTPFFEDLASGIGDIFSDLMYNIAENGFGRTFSYIYDGFKKLLFRMAVEYLQSQLMGLLMRGLGSVFGSLDGGSKIAGMKPDGSKAISNSSLNTNTLTNNYSSQNSSIVNKMGSLIGAGSSISALKSAGSVLSSQDYSIDKVNTINQSGGESGGNVVNIVFNVSTPDAQSFRKTQNQLMLEARKSMERNGYRLG